MFTSTELTLITSHAVIRGRQQSCNSEQEIKRHKRQPQSLSPLTRHRLLAFVHRPKSVGFWMTHVYDQWLRIDNKLYNYGQPGVLVPLVTEPVCDVILSKWPLTPVQMLLEHYNFSTIYVTSISIRACFDCDKTRNRTYPYT